MQFLIEISARKTNLWLIFAAGSMYWCVRELRSKIQTIMGILDFEGGDLSRNILNAELLKIYEKNLAAIVQNVKLRYKPLANYIFRCVS